MYKMKVLEELSAFKTSTQYLNQATLSRPKLSHSWALHAIKHYCTITNTRSKRRSTTVDKVPQK